MDLERCIDAAYLCGFKAQEIETHTLVTAADALSRAKIDYSNESGVHSTASRQSRFGLPKGAAGVDRVPVKARVLLGLFLVAARRSSTRRRAVLRAIRLLFIIS